MGNNSTGIDLVVGPKWGLEGQRGRENAAPMSAIYVIPAFSLKAQKSRSSKYETTPVFKSLETDKVTLPRRKRALNQMEAFYPKEGPPKTERKQTSAAGRSQGKKITILGLPGHCCEIIK